MSVTLHINKHKRNVVTSTTTTYTFTSYLSSRLMLIVFFSLTSKRASARGGHMRRLFISSACIFQFISPCALSVSLGPLSAWLVLCWILRDALKRIPNHTAKQIEPLTSSTDAVYRCAAAKKRYLGGKEGRLRGGGSCSQMSHCFLSELPISWRLAFCHSHHAELEDWTLMRCWKGNL